MDLNKKIKNLKWFDISQIKLATAAGIIFVLKIWPASMTWVNNTSAWWFIVLAIIFSIRPIYLMVKD